MVLAVNVSLKTALPVMLTLPLKAAIAVGNGADGLIGEAK